ncbi:MAG: DUF1707 domain-containing protein [Acidimicrobiales bacterium]
MVNIPHNGSGHPAIAPNQPLAPLPVPELETGEGFGELAAPIGPGSSVAVSDEDRNRFGVLLDHAEERGLLGPGEYQVRLRELAEATSIEEMTEIVSALPAFGAVATPAKRPDATPDPLAFGTLPSTRRKRNPPWVLLVIVVAVILLAMAALAIVAAHVVHSHNAGAQTAEMILSAPRL